MRQGHFILNLSHSLLLPLLFLVYNYFVCSELSFIVLRDLAHLLKDLVDISIRDKHLTWIEALLLFSCILNCVIMGGLAYQLGLLGLAPCYWQVHDFIRCSGIFSDHLLLRFFLVKHVQRVHRLLSCQEGALVRWRRTWLLITVYSPIHLPCRPQFALSGLPNELLLLLILLGLHQFVHRLFLCQLRSLRVLEGGFESHHF